MVAPSATPARNVHEEAVACLPPLKFAYVTMLGHDCSEVVGDVAAGAMRPLRDPGALDEAELI